MAEYFTVNSLQSREAYKKQVDQWFDEHKYLTFSGPRIGPDRSLDQNALFQKWTRQCAAYYLSKNEDEVTDGEHEGMKFVVKRDFYNATGYPWMLITMVNPKTGKTKAEYQSSAKWLRGEAFMVLTWLQQTSATDGLILESKGEYAKLQREQNK